VPPAAHEELAVEDFPFLLTNDPDQQSGNGAHPVGRLAIEASCPTRWRLQEVLRLTFGCRDDLMHSGQGGGPYIGGAGSGSVGVGTGAGLTGVVGSGGSGSGWGNGVGSVIRTSVESCTATSMRHRQPEQS